MDFSKCWILTLTFSSKSGWSYHTKRALQLPYYWSYWLWNVKTTYMKSLPTNLWKHRILNLTPSSRSSRVITLKRPYISLITGASLLNHLLMSHYFHFGVLLNALMEITTVAVVLFKWKPLLFSLNVNFHRNRWVNIFLHYKWIILTLLQIYKQKNLDHCGSQKTYS